MRRDTGGHGVRLASSYYGMRKACVLIMRGIAQEVAEHATCYLRHKQLCELVGHGTPFRRCSAAEWRSS